MNIGKDKSKFKKLRIILDSERSSPIVMGRLVNNLGLEEYASMQWNTQAENITTNLKVKIYLTLPALSATNVVTWNCHVDDSAKDRYNMILGQYLLTELSLNLKSSENAIEADDGPFNRSTTPMVDLGTYIYLKI